MKNGTVKHSSKFTLTVDNNPQYDRKPGFYVWFGMWKGPFTSAENAKSAYNEWAWELKHS